MNSNTPSNLGARSVARIVLLVFTGVGSMDAVFDAKRKTRSPKTDNPVERFIS